MLQNQMMMLQDGRQNAPMALSAALVWVLLRVVFKGTLKAAARTVQYLPTLGSLNTVESSYLSNKTKADGSKNFHLSYREMEKLLQRIMKTGQHTSTTKAWNSTDPLVTFGDWRI